MKKAQEHRWEIVFQDGYYFIDCLDPCSPEDAVEGEGEEERWCICKYHDEAPESMQDGLRESRLPVRIEVEEWDEDGMIIAVGKPVSHTEYVVWLIEKERAAEAKRKEQGK